MVSKRVLEFSPRAEEILASAPADHDGFFGRLVGSGRKQCDSAVHLHIVLATKYEAGGRWKGPEGKKS